MMGAWNLYFEIVTIGHKALKEEKLLLKRYQDRLGRHLRVQNIQNEAAVATVLRQGKREKAYLVLMDETGEDLSSVQAADKLKDLQDRAQIGRICFVIGPAEGCSAQLQNQADWLWRFGRVTWPHHLMQVLLAEQIYRLTTIMNGHPYHRL